MILIVVFFWLTVYLIKQAQNKHMFSSYCCYDIVFFQSKKETGNYTHDNDDSLFLVLCYYIFQPNNEPITLLANK